MRRSVLALVVTALVAASLVLAGCGGDGSPARERPAPALDRAPSVTAPSVEAVLTRHRRDTGTRTIQVTVTNTGAVPVAVDRVRLDTPDFTPRPDAHPGTTIAPGQRVDLPVPYGEAACAGGVPARARLAHAVLTLHAEEAQPVVVRLPVPDAGPLLGRLLADDCRLDALARVVEVRLGPSWSRDGDRLRGTLLLGRAGGADPVTVTQVAGSVLFTLAPVPGSGLPTLRPGDADASAPVAVTASRCDGHARGESKRPYQLTAWVRVADGADQAVPVTPGRDDRALFDRFWADACG